MKRKLITFILFQLCLCGKSFSSFELNENVQQAYLQIIRLNFDAGKKLLVAEQQSNPTNQLPLLYFNYIDFLKAFISEENNDIELFDQHSGERMDLLAKEDSPFFLFTKADLLMQQIIIHIKAGDYINAAWKINKAFVVVSKNSENFPDFPLNKKISGVLKVFIGLVPENYRWLIDFAGLKGSIREGTNELATLLKESTGTEYEVYSEELLCYLGYIQNSFSQNPQDMEETIAKMRHFCPGNAMMRFCISGILIKNGKNDEALHWLTDTLSKSEEINSLVLLSYKTGLAKLNKLDFSAEVDFQFYVTHFHGINQLRSAYQKLAWISLLQGNKKKYFDCMQNCKIAGSNLTDEDKEATEEFHSGDVQNPVLLRARLLFDGGYYKEALNEIAGKSIQHFPRFKDQLEVTYRLARIFQRLSLTDKAIPLFEQTIKNGAASKYYFAANSALLLGNNFEEKNNPHKARSYYRKCLAMRNHGYQNSIDQKAKAGLARLNVN